MNRLILILAKRGCGKTTLARGLAAAYPADRVVVHDPRGEYPYHRRVTAMDDTCDVQPGDLLLLDECDTLAPATHYRRGADRWLPEVIHLGRHDEIAMIAIARRPANIHSDIKGLATEGYFGRMHEPRDLQYLTRAYSSELGGCRDLPPFEFIRLDL